MQACLPSATGRYAWRRDRGLLSISDHVHRYRATRFVRKGARSPLPEDLLTRREVRT